LTSLRDSTVISAPPTRFFKVAVSALVIFQLWAVVSRPIEFATLGPFGASPSATLFRAPVRAYSQFTYLDHGYAFFAPDPGPSHLIEAEIVSPDGQRIERRYPDRTDQRPRLLYHRHFMLAEFLNDIFHPPGDPPPGLIENPEALRAWRQARRRYESVRDSVVHRLQVRYPDSQIEVRRLEHRPPGLPEFMEARIQLDDPQLYRILFDTFDGEPEPLIQTVPVPSQAERHESDSVEQRQ
jgi:hypothetical protein